MMLKMIRLSDVPILGPTAGVRLAQGIVALGRLNVKLLPSLSELTAKVSRLWGKESLEEGIALNRKIGVFHNTNEPIITQQGLNRIEQHLDQILENQKLPIELQAGERSMLQRLRLENKTPQDIEFYLHELKESAIFRRTNDLSLSHRNALEWRNVTERFVSSRCNKC